MHNILYSVQQMGRMVFHMSSCLSLALHQVRPCAPEKVEVMDMLQAAEADVAGTKAKLADSASALAKGITLQQECGVVLTTDSEGMPCTDGDEPCEPLVPLWKAERDAKAALATAEGNLTSCKLSLIHI